MPKTRSRKMNTVQRTLNQVAGDQTLTRQYRIHVPSQGSTGRPLLLFFHGHGGNALQFSQDPAFDNWANRGYVFAFLQALPQTEPDGTVENSWRTLQTPPPAPQDLDENFTLLAIQAIQAEFGTNPNKIYCAGFSQGTNMCWQMYVHQAQLIQGFCTAGRGVSVEFEGLVPSVLRPWMTTIGRQDESWEGHKNPPLNDASGALETRDYVCNLNRRTTVSTPMAGSPAGVPPNPTTGTKLVVFDYQTSFGSPSAPCGAGEVRRVTKDAGHRWFDFSKGDNFSMTGLCVQFWVAKAGLPAPA